MDDTAVAIVWGETAFFVVRKKHDWVVLVEPKQTVRRQVVLCAAVSKPWVMIALNLSQRRGSADGGGNPLSSSLIQSTAPVTEASATS